MINLKISSTSHAKNYIENFAFKNWEGCKKNGIPETLTGACFIKGHLNEIRKN
jgi:hypothetical protein